MTDHWNFAISASRGDYVLVLGDDDGLLPDAVERVRRTIEIHRPDVIYGPMDFYRWPVGDEPGMVTWIARSGSDHEVDLLALRRRILRMGGARWEMLPSVYRAFVHRRVLDELYVKTGKYCDSLIPDVYTGFAIAGLQPLRAFCLSYPIAICAMSYAPNQKPMPKINETEQQLALSHIAEYDDLGYLVSLPPFFPRTFNSFAESMLLAVSRFPEERRGSDLNYSAHLAWMLSWSRAADPFEIYRLRNDLQPFGFNFIEFAFWYSAYKVRHWYSHMLSRRIAKRSSNNVDLADVVSAAHYLMEWHRKTVRSR
jgi:glycosyltransferase involved in cell wall biosynthesis